LVEQAGQGQQAGGVVVDDQDLRFVGGEHVVPAAFVGAKGVGSAG